MNAHRLATCPFNEMVKNAREQAHGGTMHVHAARAMRKSPEWTNADRFVDETCRHTVVAKNATIATGIDLNGSWHQQANGAVRHWSAVSGEFAAR